MAKITKTQLRLEKIYDALEDLLIEDKREINKNEIRVAYRELAKKYHPDRNNSEDGKKVFIIVQKAYDFLMDNIEYIEKNLGALNKYQDFAEENLSQVSDKKEQRIKEVERLLAIKPRNNNELSLKIFDWIAKEKNWLNEEKEQWELYVPILKDELKFIIEEMDHEIEAIDKEISKGGPDIEELKKIKKIKTTSKDILMEEISSQAKIKVKEFEAREKKLKEFEFICSDLSASSNKVFDNLFSYYYSIIKEFRNDIIYTGAGVDVVSELNDSDLGITKEMGR
ncbi:TPA: J domain-containing protein [bacterium]|nr:J domain-containing protein [bacterium]